MTQDQEGRSSSPVHVTVDDTTPVHVHLKKPKKPGMRQSRGAERKASKSESPKPKLRKGLALTPPRDSKRRRRKKKLSVRGHSVGTPRESPESRRRSFSAPIESPKQRKKNKRKSSTSSHRQVEIKTTKAAAAQGASNLRRSAGARSRSKSPSQKGNWEGHWVPPPAKTSTGGKLSWKGPAHRLEINTSDDAEAIQTTLKVSDLDTDDEDRVTNSMRKYEQKIDSLMSEVGTLKNEVELQRSKREIDIRDEELDASRRVLEHQDSKLRVIQSELEMTETENKMLRKNVDRLRDDVDINRSAKQQAEDERERLMNMLVEVEMDGQAAAKQVSALRDILRRLREESRWSSTDSSMLAKQRELLLERLNDFESTNRTLRRMLRDRHEAEGANVRLAEQRDVLLRKLTETEDRVQSLRGEVLDRDRVVADLRMAVDSQKEENLGLNGLQSSLESTRAHLQKQLRQKEADCNRMAVQIRSIESQLAQERIDNDHLQGLLGTAKEKADRDKEALKKATRVQKQRATRSEDALEQLNAQLLEKDSILAELSGESDSVRARSDKLHKEKSQAIAENTALKTRIAELESIMEHLEDDTKTKVETTLSKLQDKSSEATTVRLENDRLRSTIATLEDKMSTADSEVTQLRTSVRQYETLVDEYRSQMNKSRREADETMLELEDQKRESSRMKQDSQIEMDKVKSRLQARLLELEPLPELLKTTELKLHDANEQIHLYERRHGDNTKLIAELTGKINELHEENQHPSSQPPLTTHQLSQTSHHLLPQPPTQTVPPQTSQPITRQSPIFPDTSQMVQIPTQSPVILEIEQPKSQLVQASFPTPQTHEVGCQWPRSTQTQSTTVQTFPAPETHDAACQSPRSSQMQSQMVQTFSILETHEVACQSPRSSQGQSQMVQTPSNTSSQVLSRHAQTNEIIDQCTQISQPTTKGISSQTPPSSPQAVCYTHEVACQSPEIPKTLPQVTQKSSQITQMSPQMTQTPPHMTQIPPQMTQITPPMAQIPPQMTQPQVTQITHQMTQIPPQWTQIPLQMTEPQMTPMPPQIIQMAPQPPPKIEVQNPAPPSPQIVQVPAPTPPQVVFPPPQVINNLPASAPQSPQPPQVIHVDLSSTHTPQPSQDMSADIAHIDKALQTIVEQQNNQVDAMRQRMHKDQDGNRQLEGKLDGLERKLRDIEEQNRELLTNIAKREEIAHQSNMRLDEKIRENSSLQRQLEATQDEVRRLSESSREKAAAKERASQARVLELESQVSQLRAEIARIKREKEEAERKFNSRLYDLKDRLEQSHSTNRSMQNYVQFLKSSYANTFGDPSIVTSSPIRPGTNGFT